MCPGPQSIYSKRNIMEETEPEEVTVEVLDKNFKLLFKGKDAAAVQWILDNPIPPCTAYLVEFNDIMSIDEYLREWDELEYL
jgi:hypothetical protein